MRKKPPSAVVPNLPSTGPQPSESLGTAGRSLWNRVLVQYRITDAGGLEILIRACVLSDRLAAISRQIDAEGLTIATKSGPKDHPLLRHELGYSASIKSALKQLGLDVEPVRPSAGRPGYGGIGWIPAS
jgi:Phage terminase, small subunit